MSVRVAPSAAASRLTYALPPIVEPPIRARSSFAAAFEESRTMRCSVDQALLCGGLADSRESSVSRIASLSELAAGSWAPAFQDAPVPVRRSTTQTPSVGPGLGAQAAQGALDGAVGPGHGTQA